MGNVNELGAIDGFLGFSIALRTYSSHRLSLESRKCLAVPYTFLSQ